MHCHKPNTDQLCEVWISSNGKRYSEYMWNPDFPNGRTPSDNVFESFIPVNDGEQIAVNIKFQGTVVHGAADVIVDGAFVFDRRIEGHRRGHLKYQKRDWKVEEYYNVPGSLDVETMHTGGAVVAGSLAVKKLEENDGPLYVNHGGKLGIGSIAVVVSVNQSNFEAYNQSYKSQTIGNWRKKRYAQADGGIKPEHELAFTVEDDEVHFNRQQRHKRHGEQNRFGLRPWAIFVFFYRSQDAIQQANCVLRPQASVPLPPHRGDFNFADPDAIIKKRLATRAKNDLKKRRASEETEEDDQEEEQQDDEAPEARFSFDGTSSETRGHSESGSNPLFFPEAPNQGPFDARNKGLSNTAFGMQRATSYGPRRDSRISGGEIAAPNQRGESQPQGDWHDLFGDEPTGELQQQHAVDRPHNSIPGVNLGDDFDFNFYPDLAPDDVVGEIDQALQAGGYQAPPAPPAAPVARMVMSSPTHRPMASGHNPGPGDVIESTETAYQHPQQHLEQSFTGEGEEEEGAPSPLAQMISSAIQDKVVESKAAKAARQEAAKAAKRKDRPPPAPKGKPVFDPTAKTGYGFGNPIMAPKQSMAPTRQAMEELDSQGTQIHGMLQNYLQHQQSGMQPHGLPKPPQQPAPYHRPWETAKPAKPTTQYPMSPPMKVAQPATTQANIIPPSPQAAQASPHTPAPGTTSRKRSASITSRESNSSKKSRTNEMATRKAALLAALQEKNKAKDAAAKQLEKQRQAREEMDRRREGEERVKAEAEKAELAALEAELAGADGEIEAIREQGRREAEDARMRELERVREGEEE